MSRLREVIKALKNKEQIPPKSPRKVDSSQRLTQAISKAQNVLSERIGPVYDLIKGRHDAMFHHASHALGAEKACYQKSDEAHQKKCKEAARAHNYMLLRHSLENVRDRSHYNMANDLQRAVSFYRDEAHNEHYPSGGSQGDHPHCKHFINGGDYVSHKDDKNFLEDYESGKKPKVKKRTK